MDGSKVAIFMRQLGLGLRWIEHRQNLYAVKRFKVYEKSSPDIQVVKKEKKRNGSDFSFFFSVGKL